MRTSPILICVTLLCGCQLTLDLGDYAYQEVIVIPDDMPVDAMDMPRDMQPDQEDMPGDMKDEEVTQPVEISLIFTELMINTSESPQELSEYFEVSNLSEVPIDPNDLLIKSFKGDELITSLEISPFDRDKVSPIPPMGHFTFVRRLNPDETGLASFVNMGEYYEYGRAGQDFALGNSDERRLELYHRQQDLSKDPPLDTISWASLKLRSASSTATLPFREDRALSLSPEAYDPTKNDDIELWCYEANTITGPTIDLIGSPGAQLQGPCVREL